MTELPAFPVLTRAVEIHLAFASLVALAALLITASRRVSATTKYWIWVATSINFLLPVGVLVDRFRPPDLSWVLPFQDLGYPIARTHGLGAALAAVWALGAAAMLARLVLRVAATRSGVGGAPAVEGLLRPRISMPAGIERVLTAPEIDAVLLHERMHARRRDNLIRLIHEIGLCAFWFHPFAWLAGARLSLYRELSCDESVIRDSRAGDLVSALAKLANPAETLLLQAGASAFLADRIASLSAPRPTSRTANALLAAIFGAMLLAGILGSAFQSNLMHRAALGEFCPSLAAELAARGRR